VSGYARLVASGIFLVIPSCLFTTPGALSPTQIQALTERAYIERAEPVVFIGEYGSGKTHLVTGLCVAASRHGGDRS
jgi:DNA replication protein DnaC